MTHEVVFEQSGYYVVFTHLKYLGGGYSTDPTPTSQVHCNVSFSYTI